MRCVLWLVLVASCADQAFGVVTLNLAGAFAPIKVAIADGGQANILVLGDSLTYQPQSWLPVFTGLMHDAYGDAGAGYQGFSRWTGGGFNPGWLEGVINQDVAPHSSPDGLWASGSSPNLTARFDARDQYIELQYVVEPGGGRVRVEDAARNLITTLDTDAPEPGVGTWSYTFPEGQNRLWFRTLDAAPVTILGQNNITEDAGVRIHRAANGGWGVGNFLGRDWTFDAQLGLLDLDLVFVWLGQNDTAYSGEAYESSLHLLVDRLEQAAGDASIVLVGTKQTALSPAGADRLEGLVEAMGRVATQRGLGFIDLFHAAGDHAFFETHGMLLDGVHFTQAGGDYMGRLMFDAFQSDGASLTAGVGGDFNGDGLVNTQDINPFIAALGGTTPAPLYGDLVRDGTINTQDINPFIETMVQSAVGVPEPATLLVVAAGLGVYGRGSWSIVRSRL